MVELKLKSDNQKEDLRVVFPQFNDEILPMVEVIGGYLLLNGCRISWVNAPRASRNKESCRLLWTPISLCIYIDSDCRVEIHFRDIRSLRLNAEGAFGRDFYNLSWE